MSTLYENICNLCSEKNIKPGKMCVDLGLSKSLMTDLKAGRKKTIRVDTAQKIADYFGVTVDRVLGAEKETAAPKGDGAVSGVKAELYSFVDSLTDEQAAYILRVARAALER